ncbi:MAG TPA: DUF559 domain-containing protein [Rhodothermales bacterium]|nr:DUF559 domain-containing protein [Rhodothermales bacterium]
MPGPNDQIHNRQHLKARRQELRSSATPAEAALWKLLKGSGLNGRKFRRQHSVGSFILDFYCPSEKLAIELDGELHRSPFRHAYDSTRSDYLAEQGIRIVRFENQQVMQQPDLVLDVIAHHFHK